MVVPFAQHCLTARHVPLSTARSIVSSVVSTPGVYAPKPAVLAVEPSLVPSSSTSSTAVLYVAACRLLHPAKFNRVLSIANSPAGLSGLDAQKLVASVDRVVPNPLLLTSRMAAENAV